MDRNDYTDPQCPFCTDQFKETPPVHQVNVTRVVEKLDDDFSRNDYAAAERHLRYWIGEAEQGHDDRGLLSLKNELMGLMRKLGRGEEAQKAAGEALALVDRIGFGDTVTAGTTFVNAATVYKAFGRSAEAIPIYEKAAAIYERELSDGDMRLGSLYNNMGLALADLAVDAAENGRMDESGEYYDRADAAYAAALRCMKLIWPICFRRNTVLIRQRTGYMSTSDRRGRFWMIRNSSMTAIMPLYVKNARQLSAITV